VLFLLTHMFSLEVRRFNLQCPSLV